MKNKLKCILSFSAAVALCLAGTPLIASEADDKMVSTIERTYVFRTFLSDEAITTEAKDGVVTLTGTVAEDSQRILALETVGNLPGVTRVENKLVTVAEETAEKADYWMGKKVKLNLFFHRHVDAMKTGVSVKDGVVTLRGEASSAAQKDLTSEYAMDINGVKEVKNEMSIAAVPVPVERTASEKIDDASVVAQVRAAFMAHRSTSSINAGVVAREGEVTLTGIAKNEAEKSLVTKLVTDIQGVTGVQNQMTIAEPVTK